MTGSYLDTSHTLFAFLKLFSVSSRIGEGLQPDEESLYHLKQHALRQAGVSCFETLT
jgi:hypothetical protein